MKISDEVRDDAAVLCAAMGDWCCGWRAAMDDWCCGWPPGEDFPPPLSAWAGTKALRVSELAAEAVLSVSLISRSLVFVRWREAEALLRDGWCPGDPVYLLKVSP